VLADTLVEGKKAGPTMACSGGRPSSAGHRHRGSREEEQRRQPPLSSWSSAHHSRLNLLHLLPTAALLLLLGLASGYGPSTADAQSTVVTTRRCGMRHERVGFNGFISGLAWQVRHKSPPAPPPSVKKKKKNKLHSYTFRRSTTSDHSLPALTPLRIDVSGRNEIFFRVWPLLASSAGKAFGSEKSRCTSAYRYLFLARSTAH
jgi:hypothetical protein